MLQYLGRLLACHAGGIPVRYLSKAEADPIWKDGVLLAVDPQGLVFETADAGQRLAECLPWASVGSIRVALEEEGR
jgi:hypothetical protein